MALVKGENVIVTIYNGGEWQTYACGKSASISIDTDLIETSTTGTGINRTYLPTANTFSGTIDGLVNLDTPGMVTLPSLIALQLSQQLLNTRFTFIDEAENVFIFNANFYITNTSVSGAFSDAASFNIQMKGTGVPSTSSTPVTPIITQVKRYDFTTSQDQTTVTVPAISGKYILEFVTDGIGNAEILTGSETPIDKEVVYDILTGSFTWAIPAEAGIKIYILYQDL